MQPHDAQLLEEFTRSGSHEAFARLSQRYVNLVYSSALRQLTDPHAAEDVTQAVFIILARKASSLKPNVILATWLLQTTTYAVKNARRADLRRRHHEQEAAQMRAITQPDEAAQLWQQVGPAIDAAVHSLSAPYRDAVVLRYFDGQSFEEVARRLQITEEAARQRISRAVAELRTILAKRGVAAPALTAATLVGVLETSTLHAAPSSLSAACAAIASAFQSAPWLIAKGVLTMLLLKKIALAVSVMLLLMIGAGVVAVVSGGATAGPVPADATTNVQASDPKTLRPAVEGKVVDATGNPLPAAHVYLADPYHPVTVYDDQQTRATWVEISGHAGQAGYDQKPANRLFTTTDAQGKFRFEPAEIPTLKRKPGSTPPVIPAFGPRDFAVVVASEKGFAHVLPDAFAGAGNQIAVSPWGQIEGTLLREGQPLRNVPVRLSRMTHLWEGYPFMVQYEDQVITDDAGHFKFPQVAPGDAWLTHSATGGAMGIGDPAAYLRVEPGKSQLLNLGGNGRPVIGQLVEPANLREQIIWVDTYHHTGGTMRIEPYPLWEQPANWFELSWEQRAARYAQWSTTEAGRSHNENLFPIQIDVRPDGTFRAADVPPGKYKLSLATYEGGRGRELLGGLSTIVQVEPIAPGKTPEPQNLGRLTMPIKERLQVEDAAPDFAVNRLDGPGHLKLSDYKGKLLLIQFWSSELPVAAMDLQYVQRVAALAEKQKEKLAVVGIALGRDLEHMRKLADGAGINWPQGTTEPSSKCANDYHVTLYGVFLIGPDGKILARQLSDRQIMPAVEKALAQDR
jgi:RNA polymerase sigma factor (sigma-70 family)